MFFTFFLLNPSVHYPVLSHPYNPFACCLPRQVETICLSSISFRLHYMKLELGARETCGSSGVLFDFRLLAGKHNVSGQWLPVSNLRNYKHFSLSPNFMCLYLQRIQLNTQNRGRVYIISKFGKLSLHWMYHTELHIMISVGAFQMVYLALNAVGRKHWTKNSTHIVWCHRLWSNNSKFHFLSFQRYFYKPSNPILWTASFMLVSKCFCLWAFIRNRCSSLASLMANAVTYLCMNSCRCSAIANPLIRSLSISMGLNRNISCFISNLFGSHLEIPASLKWLIQAFVKLQIETETRPDDLL